MCLQNLNRKTAQEKTKLWKNIRSLNQSAQQFCQQFHQTAQQFGQTAQQFPPKSAGQTAHGLGEILLFFVKKMHGNLVEKALHGHWAPKKKHCTMLHPEKYSSWRFALKTSKWSLSWYWEQLKGTSRSNHMFPKTVAIPQFRALLLSNQFLHFLASPMLHIGFPKKQLNNNCLQYFSPMVSLQYVSNQLSFPCTMSHQPSETQLFSCQLQVPFHGRSLQGCAVP